ncbi:cytochrome P450 [Talaromyces proteolyticus]|uniref:Cytochrome P450 n=1 Tax=Talaromyces proteolyticus TaxID=1131652 RepID=A0AAD4PTU2_9EURO|nr:cytochrome P450 [Talaromyces proteolyticus]KAH8693908.1 cytochrome P450 [Talaromyces proteolyticus]
MELKPTLSLYTVSPPIWLLAGILLFFAWRWSIRHHKVSSNGEPPLVPYLIPWLGHGFSLINDINGFVEWVRSSFPSSGAVTVQVAGRHLYLIFDAKLASQIYRRSDNFLFDPFNLMVFRTTGGTKNDLEIAQNGARLVKTDPNVVVDGTHFMHGFHIMTKNHLSGEFLEELTRRFIETLCKEIDRNFPISKNGKPEWRTMDLCHLIKSLWTHASIEALMGTNIYTFWPEIDDWIWEFDSTFPMIIAQYPSLLFPKPYKVREEGIRKLIDWERMAREAEEEGKIKSDDPNRLWDPYWGHAYSREASKFYAKFGVSERGRAGNKMGIIWGIAANAIPVAMQVINQTVLNPTTLEELHSEISRCQTGPLSLDMGKVTTQPKLKSMFLEALRWATASPSPRVVREDCEIGGYRFKSNSMVMIPARILQLEPATWEIPGNEQSKPDLFWPERFLDGDQEHEAHRVDENIEAEANHIAGAPSSPEELKPRRVQVEPISGPKSKDIQRRILSLRPFGGGTTICSGRHFATNEILGGLATLLLRLEIEVIDEELIKHGVPQPDLRKQGGLFPDRPLMVRVRRRMS